MYSVYPLQSYSQAVSVEEVVGLLVMAVGGHGGRLKHVVRHGVLLLVGVVLEGQTGGRDRAGGIDRGRGERPWQQGETVAAGRDRAGGRVYNNKSETISLPSVILRIAAIRW
jgi:hypothetical protein